MSDEDQVERTTEAAENAADKDISFPMKLMDILSNDEYQGIIQWLPQGDGFIIHDKQRCADEVLPHHFGSVSKYASFTRRLNRWNFIFQQKGNKKALYFHPLFVRSNPSLCLNMRPRRQKNYNQKYRDNKRQHLLQEIHEQQQALSFIHNNSMMSSPHGFVDGNRVLTHCPSFTAAAGGHPYLVQEQAIKSPFEAYPHLNESSMSFALHVPPQQQLLQNQSVYNDENLYNPYLHPPSYGHTSLQDYNAVMHNVTGQSSFHRGVMMGNNHHQFNKASSYVAHHPVPGSSVLVDQHTSPPPVVMGQAMPGPLQYFVPSSAAGSSTSDQHTQFVRDGRYTGNNNSSSSQPMMFHRRR